MAEHKQSNAVFIDDNFDINRIKVLTTDLATGRKYINFTNKNDDFTRKFPFSNATIVYTTKNGVDIPNPTFRIYHTTPSKVMYSLGFYENKIDKRLREPNCIFEHNDNTRVINDIIIHVSKQFEELKNELSYHDYFNALKPNANMTTIINKKYPLNVGDYEKLIDMQNPNEEKRYVAMSYPCIPYKGANSEVPPAELMANYGRYFYDGNVVFMKNNLKEVFLTENGEKINPLNIFHEFAPQPIDLTERNLRARFSTSVTSFKINCKFFYTSASKTGFGLSVKAHASGMQTIIPNDDDVKNQVQLSDAELEFARSRGIGVEEITNGVENMSVMTTEDLDDSKTEYTDFDELNAD